MRFRASRGLSFPPHICSTSFFHTLEDLTGNTNAAGRQPAAWHTDGGGTKYQGTDAQIRVKIHICGSRNGSTTIEYPVYNAVDTFMWTRLLYEVQCKVKFSCLWWQGRISLCVYCVWAGVCILSLSCLRIALFFICFFQVIAMF